MNQFVGAHHFHSVSMVNDTPRTKKSQNLTLFWHFSPGCSNLGSDQANWKSCPRETWCHSRLEMGGEGDGWLPAMGLTVPGVDRTTFGRRVGDCQERDWKSGDWSGSRIEIQKETSCEPWVVTEASVEMPTHNPRKERQNDWIWETFSRWLYIPEVMLQKVGYLPFPAPGFGGTGCG